MFYKNIFLKEKVLNVSTFVLSPCFLNKNRAFSFSTESHKIWNQLCPWEANPIVLNAWLLSCKLSLILEGHLQETSMPSYLYCPDCTFLYSNFCAVIPKPVILILKAGIFHFILSPQSLHFVTLRIILNNNFP